MQKFVDDKHLVALAGALENDELGGAVRLLSRIISSGKPVPARRARIITQMSEEKWGESRDAILEHFKLEADEVSHVALDEALLPRVSKPAGAPQGTTGEMPIVHPTRSVTVPTYTNRDAPERISIKRAAFDLITEIFKRSDQSANTARAVLASLLKNWPAGDVYEAINAAEKQDFLADPRSWIVAHLQRNSRPHVHSRSSRETTPPPMRTTPRKVVTPQTAGVSESTARRIRNQNARLRLDLGIETPEQK